jgi:hypothetical protein
VKYAVVRRTDVAGEVFFPGDFVHDPDRASLLIERGFIVPLGPASEVPNVVLATDGAGGVDNAPAPVTTTTELTINELRAQARSLGLLASGSKADLTAAIAAEEGRLSAEQASSASPSAEEPALNSSQTGDATKGDEETQ